MNEGLLLKAFVEYLRSDRNYEEEARRAGVSLGFLAAVMAANIDEYIAEMVDWAAQCREFYCPECNDGEYYNANNVPRDENGFLCSKCGRPLSSSCCAGCGRNIADVGGTQVHGGWAYCSGCSPG
ncbi:hypothetical protein SAMN00808754_1692 [Thermanaeromonas toyohensis ToBE]|uniref:Uncharacterized protein n=1 Tax=Thermanaeromonas toyohensis ToBE TaxID=698762 RepID=A0A1W1VU59_9FIRM|nr:hypothetical protein [Thermanaeromonas toyohensis]SMB96856.1 hypothetical protein SAMN00808754_1692 [Thermanaeromonas toyohensis ToBE]